MARLPLDNNTYLDTERQSTNMVVILSSDGKRHEFPVQSYVLEAFARKLAEEVREFQKDCDLVASLTKRK